MHEGCNSSVWGGCTGEVISSEGLLITNHHCGYSQIQKHSSLQHDYLTNGFWAMSKEEELPNPGLTVTFLKRMEDVTERVMQGVSDTMENTQRDNVINSNIKGADKDCFRGHRIYSSRQAVLYGSAVFPFCK